jgi:uncharacterized OB-fold protein
VSDRAAISVGVRNKRKAFVDSIIMNYCSECGAEVEEDQTYCLECGVRLDQSEDTGGGGGSITSVVTGIGIGIIGIVVLVIQ